MTDLSNDDLTRLRQVAEEVLQGFIAMPPKAEDFLSIVKELQEWRAGSRLCGRHCDDLVRQKRALEEINALIGRPGAVILDTAVVQVINRISTIARQAFKQSEAEPEKRQQRLDATLAWWRHNEHARLVIERPYGPPQHWTLEMVYELFRDRMKAELAGEWPK